MGRRLNTELFIARRISSTSRGGKNNVMTRIATATIAISVAVMIIAVAVIVGFRHEITGKLVGFDSHMRIVNLNTNTSFETVPIKYDTLLVNELAALSNVASVEPYATKGGIIKTDEAIQGIVLKGVAPGSDLSFFEDKLVAGTMPRLADSVRHKDLLISQSVANMLSLDVDDRVEILFVGSGQRPMRRDRFKVSGIYSTGMNDFDNVMTITDIRNVQRLNNWDANQISGYEVMSVDFSRIKPLGNEIYGIIYERAETMEDVLKVEDIMSMSPYIFDWLKAHNVNGAVIITIMLIVSLLNMISAMLIILLEKTSMIGILKALGMKNVSVQRIFLWRSGRIILNGMLWGNVFGIGLALLQKYTGVVKLDNTGYMLTEVPISLGWQWWLLLNIGVPVVMVLLLMIPAMVTSKIKPDRTIRYK